MIRVDLPTAYCLPNEAVIINNAKLKKKLNKIETLKSRNKNENKNVIHRIILTSG